ncbi:alpha/beta-hydrolase family-like protein, partial [Trifolium medium]|nr:alpha/beta-hydrolase family-like protein [Trifolium medium]
GGIGGKGIGIKILEGTTVLGLSRTHDAMELDNADFGHEEPLNDNTPSTLVYHKFDDSRVENNMSSVVVPGLWDDLTYEHVAVPFATWALANWAT